MIVVYVHGCSSCGVVGALVKKAKAYAKKQGDQIEIRNSKYSDEYRYLHAGLLKHLTGRNPAIYDPIMLENNTVTKLKDL